MTAPAYGFAHRGRVVRAGTEANTYLVEVPALGPGLLSGPFMSAVPGLAAGDAVLLLQVGLTGGELVIVGRIPPGESDFSLPIAISDVTGLQDELDDRVTEGDWSDALLVLVAVNNNQDARLGAAELRLDLVESTNTTQNTRLTSVEGVNTTQNTRLTAIETLNTTQTTRLDGIDTLNTTQNTRLTAIETLNTTQDGRLTSAEGVNTTQNTRLTSAEGRLTSIETLNTTQDGRLTSIETLNTTQTSRLDGIDTLNTTQNTRLTSIETLNTTQDGRLTSIEGVNTTQGTAITNLQAADTALQAADTALQTADTNLAAADTALSARILTLESVAPSSIDWDLYGDKISSIARREATNILTTSTSALYWTKLRARYAFSAVSARWAFGSATPPVGSGLVDAAIFTCATVNGTYSRVGLTATSAAATAGLWTRNYSSSAAIAQGVWVILAIRVGTGFTTLPRLATAQNAVSTSHTDLLHPDANTHIASKAAVTSMPSTIAPADGTWTQLNLHPWLAVA